MPWPEFSWFLTGLLSVESRLHRYLAPPADTPDDPEGGEQRGG